MNSYDTHIEKLSKLFESFVETDQEDNQPLIQYFVDNASKVSSENLDIARAFIRVIEKNASEDMHKAWKISLRLAQFPFEEAPTEDSYNLVTFTGLWGVGLIAGLSPAYIEMASPIIQEFLNNPKTKEAFEGAKKGITEILVRGGNEAQHLLDISKEKLAQMDIDEAISKSKETLVKGKERLNESKEKIKGFFKKDKTEEKKDE